MFNLLFTILINFSLIALILITVFLLKFKAAPDSMTSSVFECGFLTKALSPMFSSRFFLVAIIFLLFDLEVIILFPLFILSLDLLLMAPILLGGLFLVLLTGGLFLEWNNKALNWAK